MKDEREEGSGEGKQPRRCIRKGRTWRKERKMERKNGETTERIKEMMKEME